MYVVLYTTHDTTNTHSTFESNINNILHLMLSSGMLTYGKSLPYNLYGRGGLLRIPGRFYHIIILSILYSIMIYYYV